MKLHFLFFLGAESSEGDSEKSTLVDVSWKNSDAFKLPDEINLQTEWA